MDTLPAINITNTAFEASNDVLIHGHVDVDTLPAINVTNTAFVEVYNDALIHGRVDVDTLPAITGSVAVSNTFIYTQENYQQH